MQRTTYLCLALLIALMASQCSPSINKGSYTAQDQALQLQLNEHTKAWLQPESTLEVTKVTPHQIEARLQGRIYISSSKDNQATVLVHTPLCAVEAKYGDYAIDGDPVTSKIPLRVSSGSASCIERNGEGLIIHTGEHIYLNDGKPEAYRASDALNHDSWRTGQLAYDGIPLLRIGGDLTRHYGAHVMVGRDITNCLVSGSWDNMSLEDLLDDLTDRLPITVEKSKGVWLVSGVGCERE